MVYLLYYLLLYLCTVLYHFVLYIDEIREYRDDVETERGLWDSIFLWFCLQFLFGEN